MTADVTESGQESGAGTPPVDQTSPNAGSQPSTVDVEALAKALMPKVEELVERKTQSVKDKRFQTLENQVDSFESKLADFNEWKKAGLTDDDALWRMKVESQLKMNEAPPDKQPGKQEPVASVETQAILKALGLAENNPEVTKILRETNDVAAQLLSFVNLSKSQMPIEPNPAAVQPSGSGGSINQSAEAIATQLIEAQKDPLRNHAQIKALTAELDKVVDKL
jgi:hypothetical protein